MPLLTLLTDFGTTDYYVAAVRGVLARLAPEARLLDLAHDLPPGDVEEAAWMLWASARWYPAGTVHLAVVDPGVGSSRRILAARAGGSYFVAPDNGLLTPFLDGAPASWEALQGELGGGPDPGDGVAARVSVRTVERKDLFLPGPGATFHGRDRFAPVAAFLARREAFAELGPELADPVRLEVEPPRAEGEPPQPGTRGAVLRGRVVHVDRFGNLVTDLPVAWLGDGGGSGEPRSPEGAGPESGSASGGKLSGGELSAGELSAGELPAAGRSGADEAAARRPIAVRVEVEGHTVTDRASHYAGIPANKPALVPGSLGTLELSLRGESLADRWELARGARVTVRVLPHSPG